MLKSVRVLFSICLLIAFVGCSDGNQAQSDGGAGDQSSADGRSGDLSVRPSDLGGGDGDGTSTQVDAGCPIGTVAVKPTVMLIIDRSSSMDGVFGTSTRWSAVRDVLVQKPDGIVYALDQRVRFGLSTYHGERGDSVCPVVELVLPAAANYPAINTAYSAFEPVAGTPTAEGVQKVFDDMKAAQAITSSTFFVLATDGLPRGCVSGTSEERAKKSVDTLKAIHGAGVKTFVIGVGEDAVDRAHLQDLANAGAGVGATDPDTKFYEVSEAAALRDALGAILNETFCQPAP